MDNSETKAIHVIKNLWVEAGEAVEIIRKAYQFEIGEKEKRIYYLGGNAEYLTYDGLWKARYLYQSYDVLCTPEGIYEVYLAEHLVKHGELIQDEETKKNAKASESFRAFVEATRKKLAEKE